MKCTKTKSKTNADIFGRFLKSTVEKSLTYAVGLIMHNLKQSICGNKYFTTNTTYATRHDFNQAICRDKCNRILFFVMSEQSASKQGIDESPKSEIENRKKNMESIYRISKREKRNVEICFLVPEEEENFCKKIREICNFLQF